MTQNKRYAVTGGIGSGKSLVCAYLRQMDFPVFSCDEISRELWQETEYLEGLSALFPECAERGTVDKSLLSRFVFRDSEALARLNAYAHPRILRRLFSRMEPYPVAFAEVPLLYEAGLAPCFDGVIAVVREREARVRAVAQRDGLTLSEIESRMQNQCDSSVYAENGAWILDNCGTEEELRAALTELLLRNGICG